MPSKRNHKKRKLLVPKKMIPFVERLQRRALLDAKAMGYDVSAFAKPDAMDIEYARRIAEARSRDAEARRKDGKAERKPSP